MLNRHAVTKLDDFCLLVDALILKKNSADVAPAIELTIKNCGIRQIRLDDLDGPVFNLYSEGYEPVHGISLGGNAYVAFTDIPKIVKEKCRVLHKGESAVWSISLGKLGWSEIMMSYRSVVPYAQIKSGNYVFLVELSQKPRLDGGYTSAFRSKELVISVP
ncbi:MAG TPA: hypothetical protein PKC65_15960 [Pyrinomonadaceae bacterium]|nr:hypothetical protein [Pyrinomonadaceae bacterium]